MNSATSPYSRIISYRWWIISFSFLATLLLELGIQRLAFNPDSRFFFSKQTPQLIAFEKMEDTFNRNENIYLAVQPERGGVFNGDTCTSSKV